MAGFPYMYESMFGAGYGYSEMGGYAEGPSHTHFMFWLVVYLLLAVLILGGLQVGGFHFVVRRP